MNIQLRNYQIESIDRIMNMKIGERKVLSLPTGLGKTIVMAALAKENIESRILIVVPSTELREQTIEKLQLICGNDVSVGSVQGKINQYDKNIIVATRQSLTNAKSTRMDTLNEYGNFEYILLDECHQAISQIKTIVSTIGAKSKIIGFTATPFNKDMIKIFNGFVYEKPLLDSILEGYLCEPRCYRIETTTDISQVKSVGGEFIQSQLARTINNTARNEVVIKAYLESATDRKHTLVFAASIDHANSLAECFNKNGIFAKSIDSTLDENERKETLKEFESGNIKVLVNVGILTTGYDFPATDCIVMARPTKSKMLYTQCVGRGLRLHENKEDLLLIDIVDVTSKFALWEANNIFKTKFRNGERLKENIDRIKNEAEEERARIEIERLEHERKLREEEELRIQEIELFNKSVDNAIESSELDWWSWKFKGLESMVLKITAHDIAIIFKTGDNVFRLYAYDEKTKKLTLLDKTNNLMQLIRDVDDTSLKNGSSFISKDVYWKHEPATDKQKQFIENTIKNPHYNLETLTKWEAVKCFAERDLFKVFIKLVK
ncbi:DEAD/DEAH box helicase [Clostridium tarantellae]|uniref:DEAD/DEAH box helicase n=1 Tax=Clostridium tarantellae TaxID=39493 RepID=A0A6I1MNC9_9CLOT|nr:DEAD/DEAH box helicase [Clostridium tarantellae]MPQ44470.1 DEAD/DEAH box helicase [Clostridium tarantellae]